MPSRVNFDRAAIEQFLNGPDGVVKLLLTKYTKKIEGLAKIYCPVDTGRLRASITSVVERDGGSWVGRVGTNVDYAMFVEFGTSRMAAQSFLRRALHEVVVV